MAEAEIVIWRLLPILDRPLKLEVASGGLLDATKEVQRVAAASVVELGLKILELL